MTTAKDDGHPALDIWQTSLSQIPHLIRLLEEAKGLTSGTIDKQLQDLTTRLENGLRNLDHPVQSDPRITILENTLQDVKDDMKEFKAAEKLFREVTSKLETEVVLLKSGVEDLEDKSKKFDEKFWSVNVKLIFFLAGALLTIILGGVISYKSLKGD